MKIMFALMLISILVLATQVSSLEIIGDDAVEDLPKVKISMKNIIRDDDCFWSEGTNQRLLCIATLKIKPKEKNVNLRISFVSDGYQVEPMVMYELNGEEWVENNFTKYKEYNGTITKNSMKIVESEKDKEKVMNLLISPVGGNYFKYDIEVYDDDTGELLGILDPWFNVTYAFRRPMFGNITTLSANTSFYTAVNTTMASSLETFWCNFTLSSQNSTIGYVYYNNETDYICVNNFDNDTVITLIDEGNGTNSGSLGVDVVTWLDMGSNNCNATTCTDQSIYNKLFLKETTDEPITVEKAKIGHSQYY